MKIIKYFFVIFFIASFTSACDIITSNKNYYFSDTLNSTPNDTQIVVKKRVLLIDFTGIRCTNCPEAHEKMHQFQNIYPDKIIPISIHGTGLAYPVGEYNVDLRTTDGNSIISTFGITSIPVGLIDYYDKTKLLFLSAWDDEVSNYLDEVPSLDIKITNNYNSSNRTLDISNEIKAISELTTGSKLVVYILEDSIVTRQATLEEPGYIENYIQMNVFRDAITDVWGDELFIQGALVDDIEIKNFNISIPETWNTDNLKVITFVIDSNNKVLNANFKNIK